ncbi:MAG: GIY-YIG nuclease family protein [Oxalobacteraceae bacterium]|nr:MAG: GIY-YIG nuclease family protein [Oxalobacteraceae bacterium]
MDNLSDDELLAELGLSIEQPKARSYTPREERIIAGFEDVVRFRDEHGRAPQHGEDRDIFERLYAVRLDRLRELDECGILLTSLDTHGLLKTSQADAPLLVKDFDDDTLLAELGITVEPSSDDIRVLRHVQSADERRAAEEVANRERCDDFATFKPLFEQLERDLETGARVTRPFVRDAGFLKANITEGQFFILGGQIAYVADVGDPIRASNGQTDARLRVVYSNATESNLLLRSLQRALYKDEAGRRITEPEAGPLFETTVEDGDLQSGTIYVLRSSSDHPIIAEHRDLIHKIGVTGGSVKSRINNAAKDATYLLAEVEIIASYTLFNINRGKLEALIHRVFAAAQVDLTINDRFGHPVKPREWFLVPLAVIDEVVTRIRDRTITGYRYAPTEGRLTFTGAGS